jgi:hypothetical protein
MITIDTRNEPIGNGGAAAEFVVISVSDTGVGMTPEVQARIFEPFYTTKERGRGTGLGLAAVYGIVQQLNGAISVESEPSHGAVFRIRLPATAANASDDAEQARPLSGVPVGHQTILLVEDEPGVRSFARTILARHGYRVIEAESSAAGSRCSSPTSCCPAWTADNWRASCGATCRTCRCCSSRPTRMRRC